MVCPRCAATVSATDRFCENCGFQLSGAPSPDDASDASHAPTQASIVKTCLCPPGQSKPDEDGFCQVCGMRCVPEAEAAGRHVEVSVDERLAVVSDIGRRHHSNEDSGTVAKGPGDSVILVIADGVSMSLNSASASAAAVKAALDTLSSSAEDAPMADAVRSAVAAANQAVLALPLTSSAEGPETTLVIALCRGDRVAIGWAGDSRAYLISGDTEEILTVDDSWVEEVVRSGELPRKQAEADRRAHYVTQALGMRDQPLDGHVIEHALPNNSVLFLCSDGLWNYFEQDGEIAKALKQLNPGDALSLCRWFVNAANERGGQDNVTVAAFRKL